MANLEDAKKQLGKKANAALSNALKTFETVELPKVEDQKPDDWEEMMEEQLTKEPPRLRLNSVQVPFVADWQAGQEVMIVVKAKVSEKETEAKAGGKDRSFVTLTLTSISGM